MRRVPYGCVGEVGGGRLGQDRGGGEVQSRGRVGASGDTCRGRERQKGDRAALVASTHPAPPAPGHHCGDYGEGGLGLRPASLGSSLPNILWEVNRPFENISALPPPPTQHTHFSKLYTWLNDRIKLALIKFLCVLLVTGTRTAFLPTLCQGAGTTPFRHKYTYGCSKILLVCCFVNVHMGF